MLDVSQQLNLSASTFLSPSFGNNGRDFDTCSHHSSHSHSCKDRDFDDTASYVSMQSQASTYRAIRLDSDTCTQRSPRSNPVVAAVMPLAVGSPRNREENIEAELNLSALHKGEQTARGYQYEHKVVCRLIARSYAVMCVILALTFMVFAFLNVKFGLKRANPTYTRLCSVSIAVMSLICAYRTTEVTALLRRWDQRLLEDCPAVSTTTLLMVAAGLFPTLYLLSLSIRDIRAEVDSVNGLGGSAFMGAVLRSLSVSDFYAILPFVLIVLTEYIVHVCRKGMDGIDNIWLAKQRFKVV